MTITPHLPAPDPSAKVAHLKAIRDEVAGECCSCGPNCKEHTSIKTEGASE